MSKLLKCECGDDKFTKFSQLRLLDGGNTIEQAGGWICISCHAVADRHALVKRLDLQAKKAELQRILDEEKEIESRKAKARPAPKAEVRSDLPDSAA